METPKIIDLTGKLPVHDSKHYADNRPHTRIRSVAIHHAAVDASAKGKALCEAFAKYHIGPKNRWPGIGYHFVIDTDGKVYKTNNLTTVCYHVGASNRDAVGVCLAGDLDAHPMTAEQRDSLLSLIGGYLYPLLPQVTSKEVKGHREYPGYSWKSCPGKTVSMNVLRLLIQQRCGR